MGYDTYHGYVDRVENGWVLGWAWQATRPNDPVQVDLYVDGALEASTLAQLYRADLDRVGKENGAPGKRCTRYGFCKGIVSNGVCRELDRIGGRQRRFR
jgi:hypothetical protein